MMLKIQGTEKGKAAFTWKQLEKIFEIYLEQENNNTEAIGYKVKKCPADGNYSLWWRIGIYATIPIFICFFIAVWAWKNNHFSKYCSYEQKTDSKDDLFDSESAFYTDNEKQEQVSQSVNSIIEENEYVRGPKRQSGPPVPLRGSSYGGVLESSEESSATEIFNKLSIQSESSGKASKEPRSHENSIKKSRPHRRSFYNDADSKNAFAIESNEAPKRESEEHFYDYVASSIKINRTQLKETYL
ncbi:uncharacterized protein LOC129216015 [Uloborus diversus]|uniref:uncharacterized protein LOC129216015 n=1 Tax=Uloborus diversus TaxID=327109 RepID=UPI00240A7D47|nr:uncharacterized protein LOC129216015 [Uloborus diversus]